MRRIKRHHLASIPDPRRLHYGLHYAFQLDVAKLALHGASKPRMASAVTVE